MTRDQQNSVARLQAAIKVIEETVPKEQKRQSQQRKRALESVYSSLKLHAGKLDLELPRMGVWYSPGEYLEHARIAAHELEQYMEKHNGDSNEA